MEDEPTFKEAIEELEKITDSLESGELELEKSLELFERGVELIKYCQNSLDSAQAKVELLVDSLEGEIESVPLEESAEEEE
ncbi:MAG: exodeoxyribonuclease VII small subunit [Actinomycetia bacterium]|nr:exodeoxyribonuclease VII small subunit [Actinomycetota bacterium]MCG2796618.1 exodeoxyribonuclease VII small subunit [Actinomycetes bacterium]MBU4241517.1 exodeoxyribonuclease VII small subunit [Actinomycetota bacterium]MBU4301140.1 exodeoxyribonuclease VII small subunit [Actinomycetota bacterium]MBU4392528.1 exodeoxyribonuclease VII small subunit [Actinomycetota bacterium]